MTLTSIKISTETRDHLRNLGEKGMTYDELINALIKFFENPELPEHHHKRHGGEDPMPAWVRERQAMARTITGLDE